MATQIYIDKAHRKQVASPFSSSDGALPPFVAGDTLPLSLYFLDPGTGSGTPFRLNPETGATQIICRLRNAKKTYAETTTGWSQVVATGGAAVTTTQAGVYSTLTNEIQRITFGSAPAAGRFTITFGAMSGAEGVGWSPSGTTPSFAANESASQIKAAIDAMTWVKRGTSDLQKPFGAVTWIDSHTLELNWGQRGDRPPVTVSITDLNFDSHWDADLALTAGDFADLFNPDFGPAYLEVLLTESGGPQTLVLQRIVTGAGSSGGGGGTTGSGDYTGIYFDGDYTIAMAVGVVTEESRPFPTDETARIFRQPYHQLRASYRKTPTGTANCPDRPSAFLINETGLDDIGGGIVRFERVWATIPATRTEKGIAIKTYKYLAKLFSNGKLAGFGLTTRSATVVTSIEYTYSRNPAALPVESPPDVIVHTIGPFTFANVYDGFPYNPALDSPPDSNEFVHFLNGDVSLWMGDIYCRRRVYG